MQASLRVVGNRDEHAPTDRIGVCFCDHKCRRGAVVRVSVIFVAVSEMLSAKVRTRPCGAGFHSNPSVGHEAVCVASALVVSVMAPLQVPTMSFFDDCF